MAESAQLSRADLAESRVPTWRPTPCAPVTVRFRTQLCKEGSTCKRYLCFFAHRWAAAGAGQPAAPAACRHVAVQGLQ